MGTRSQCENQRMNALNVYTPSFSKSCSEVCCGFAVQFLTVCLHIYVIVFCKNLKILACSLCQFCSVWLTKNEELNDLYSSPSIIRVIKSRRMRRAWHVARKGEGRAYTGFWWGNLKERVHLEDPGVDGRIILRCIFR